MEREGISICRQGVLLVSLQYVDNNEIKTANMKVNNDTIFQQIFIKSSQLPSIILMPVTESEHGQTDMCNSLIVLLLPPL
jgi:hypothetical protein